MGREQSILAARGFGAIVLLSLAATIPFWFAPYPSLTDFPSHLARFHVMLENNPVLARHYDFHWRIVGNLGTDLLMVPLGSWLGVERAGFLIAAMIPALTVAGIVAVGHALRRPFGLGTFMALPLAYASPFLYGFLNYSLGVALSLLAFALWIRSPRPIAFIAIAWLLWLCHMAAWANFAVMVGGYEISQSQNPRVLVRRLWPVALPAIMLLFPAAAYDPQAGKNFSDKFRYWLSVLEYRHFAWDVFAVAAIVTAMIVAWREKIPFDKRVGIPALIFTALVFIIPPGLGGGDLADMRLVPMAMVLGSLAISSSSPWRWAFLALFAARLVVTTTEWHEQSQIFAQNLHALDHIPRGARVRTYSIETNGALQRSPYTHLSGYAVVRNDALVNSNFAIPGVHLLNVKALNFIDPDQVTVPSKPLIVTPEDQYLWVFHNGRTTGHEPGVIYRDAQSYLVKLQTP